MNAATALRARFLSDGVGTSSPQTLLVRLYDRLVRDLSVAEEAQRAGDRSGANTQLLHAQAIVDALTASLDTTAWDGARELAAIYAFLRSELVAANVGADADRTAACRALVEPLRDAWHTAVTGGPAPAAAAATVEASA